MGFYDFVMYYEKGKTTHQEVYDILLQRIFIKRLQFNKPTIFFIGGDSGEGKSTFALYIQDKILTMLGYNLYDYIDDINVFTPFEYPEKIKNILFEPKLKHIPFVCIHEAREFINAKDWQSFMTRAISDINALSRSQKRLNILIVSQFVKNVSSDVRYTFNYYSEVSRKMGQPARAYIKQIYKDTRDLEKPKLAQRNIRGLLIDKNTRIPRIMTIPYIEFKKPNKEITEKFEELDKNAKLYFIKDKLNKFLEKLKTKLGAPTEKINNLVNYYSNNINELTILGKRKGNKFYLSKEFKIMHGLTKDEETEFLDKLNERLIKAKIIEKIPLTNSNEGENNGEL